MENKNWWKIGALIAAGLFLFGLGFYIGRKREPDVVEKTVVKYVELPPIHDSIPTPVPVYIKTPVDSLNVLLSIIENGMYAEYFPEKFRDSLIYVTKEDTSAVILDWASERGYSETVFDSDTLGKLTFNAKVQYNRLQNFDYTYNPVQKWSENTVKTTRKFLPYVGGGVDISGSVIGQGGMFINQDAGFAIQYRYDTKLKQHTAGILFQYMF